MSSVKSSMEWRKQAFSSRNYFIDKYVDYSETNWTSFHKDTLTIASVDIMEAFEIKEEDSETDEIKFCYYPRFVEEKVQISFSFALELNGERIPFTVYTFKEYRQLNTLNILNFHIGAHSADKSKKCLEYLKKFIYEELDKKRIFK